MRAEVAVEEKEEALKTVREWLELQGTVWTGGSRLECRSVRAVLAFKVGDRWVKRGTYLGKNKEVFDAEVYAILQAVRFLNDREGRG